MKAILQKVPVPSYESFVVLEFMSPYFSIPWHFHPECELVLITEGTGKRFIGDHVSPFEPGDLVLLGSNLPHWYRSDAIYYEKNSTLNVASLVIQFAQGFAGDSFLGLPEASNIRKLLEKSLMGVEILGETRKKVISMMHTLCKKSGMDRILYLLSILNIISTSDEVHVLSSPVIVSVTMEDSIRINQIYEYVMNNYTKPIRLQEMAAVVNMCPATFCRYFKSRTRKNFTYFLNEIRISHACKLLIEDDYSVTQICYMSGYNNISFFNRKFKALKQKTPKAYKEEFSAK